MADAPKDFDDAFVKLSELGDKPIPTNFLDPAPVIQTPEQKVEADAAKVVEQTPEQKVVEQTPEEKAAAEAEAAQTPEQKAAVEAEAADKAKADADAVAKAADDDRLARFAKAVREPEPTKKETAVAPLFTADDGKFLVGFEKDWPDVARAMVMQGKALSSTIADNMYRSIAAEIGPRLAMLEELATRAQYQDLAGTVPDYDDIRDKVIEWAGKQPAYLQGPFNRVIEEGTVEEIADLIQRFRKDTGTVVPELQVKPPAQVELSPTAKQAAAKLAPVNSKRSGAVQATPQDFDGAFAEFAKNA